MKTRVCSIFLCCWVCFLKGICQTNDAKLKPVDSISRPFKPEIFTNGFIDVMNDGQVNASARFIRLFIGEPGKFVIPLSFYSGVSANNFQDNTNQTILKSNDHLVNNYINPLSGLINVSIDGIVFKKKCREKISRAGLLYHAGERVLTGFKAGAINSANTGKPVNFLNGFVSAGPYFQTGAWERSNARNMGVFWICFRYITCFTNPRQIRNFLPDIETNGIYVGYAVAFGVEINNLINLKAIYYKYTKSPEIDYSQSIYQFSFNYTFKK